MTYKWESCFTARMRRGVAQNKALEDLFIAPFAVPKPPQRFYYIFQEPVHTRREDLKDPARVDALYRQVTGMHRTSMCRLPAKSLCWLGALILHEW